jgi:hypothetical protein
LTLNEFKKKLSTSEGRADLGIDLTGDHVAVILADDELLDSWYQKTLTAAIEPDPAEPHDSVALDEPAPSVDATKQGQPAVLSSPDQPSIERRNRRIFIGLLSLVAVLVATFVIIAVVSAIWTHDEPANADSNTSVIGDSGEPQAAPDTTFDNTPDGFKKVGNGVAVKWEDLNGQYKPCGYLDHCVVADIWSADGCPEGVYVEAKVLDANGVVVDRANDMLPALDVGEQGRSVLGWTSDLGRSARLTEVTCH